MAVSLSTIGVFAFLSQQGKRSASGRSQRPQGFPVGNVVQLGLSSCAALSIGMRVNHWHSNNRPAARIRGGR